ncbi:MAG: hypothetical protein J1E16_11230 [Muribaculaceae bacterium]|nr:hypothetical protein [Muribaculaceae bacterium]
MKRFLILPVVIACSMSAYSQVEDWDGVTVIGDVYGQKISSNGDVIVGLVGDGGCVVYTRSTKKADYYPEFDYGRGHIASDNGWVVGCQLFENIGNNLGIIAKDGNCFTPEVLKNFESSNIHSITPDGTRVCGVVSGGNKGYDYVPFYSDMDSNGNLSEINYLPIPDKDFFGYRPQYVTATWINSEGNVIAGQVKDMRGFFLYPILFTQETSGEWKYSLPSQDEFNPNHLTVPSPVGDIEDEFPDAPYPELKNYMDADKYKEFMEDDEPYENIEEYMTPEQLEVYDNALNKYWEAQEEYNLLFENYMAQYWDILDTSLVSSYMIQNALALSAEGKWLATSFTKFIPMGQTTGEHFIPYLCNLETGEWTKCIESDYNMHVNQVLPGGITVFNNISDGWVPASTYLYYPSLNKSITLFDDLAKNNPAYAEWIEKNLRKDVIVGQDPNGDLEFDTLTVTGQAAISEDFSTIAAGVDGYTLNYQKYLTYIFADVEAGLENIIAPQNPMDSGYTVFNLQGVLILKTKNIEEINSLPGGIYIINGKKISKF